MDRTLSIAAALPGRRKKATLQGVIKIMLATCSLPTIDLAAYHTSNTISVYGLSGCPAWLNRTPMTAARSHGRDSLRPHLAIYLSKLLRSCNGAIEEDVTSKSFFCAHCALGDEGDRRILTYNHPFETRVGAFHDAGKDSYPGSVALLREQLHSQSQE